MNPLTGLPDAAQLQRPGKATRLLAFIVVMVLPLGLSTLDPELGKHARFGGAAASIAAMILTTESLVTDIPAPEPAAPAGGAGGMGGMY